VNRVPRAYLVHRLAGRTRLRIRERRQDTDYFDRVHRQLIWLPGVESVRVNSGTGSVLVLHPDTPYATLERRLQALELFRIVPGREPSEAPLATLQTGVARLDGLVGSGLAGGLDLRTLAVMAAAGLAIRQMARGEVLGPGLPLLWNAFELILRRGGTREKDLPGDRDGGAVRRRPVGGSQ
jgi:hypothetical protein